MHVDLTMIDQELQQQNISFEKDFDTARICFLKVGSRVGYLVSPETADQLRTVVSIANKAGVAWRALGNLSNCFVANGFEDKMLISLKKMRALNFNDHSRVVKVAAGVMLPTFAKVAVGRGFGGFEGLIGIPGTVGGAVYMNAGAYGNEISDRLLRVEVLDPSGEFRTIERNALTFSWRFSNFQTDPKTVILAAEFELRKDSREKTVEKAEWCRKNRRTFQESRYPNLGSLFKTRDIYKEIGRRHAGYNALLYLLRKLTRFTGRTDNRLLNLFTTTYFRFAHSGNRPYSDKTLNCLVNRGDLTVKKAFEYIAWIKSIAPADLHLEIEILS